MRSYEDVYNNVDLNRQLATERDLCDEALRMPRLFGTACEICRLPCCNDNRKAMKEK